VAIGDGGAWVATTAGTVIWIDAASNDAGEPITVGGSPQGIAYGDGALWAADVFFNRNENERNPQALSRCLVGWVGEDLRLAMITNRGQKVCPNGAPETFRTDHWRCRFLAPSEGPAITQDRIFRLLQRVDALGHSVIKTEHLYTFDGEPGFSLGQGQ